MNTFAEAIESIKNGGVGILPTDTVYGIVAGYGNSDAVERIYTEKKRDTSKPCILLISKIEDLEIFNIQLSQEKKDILTVLWPGPFSIEMDIDDAQFPHITRGQGHCAVRIPESEDLREFVSQTGPLSTSSANYEGERTIETVEEAVKFFPHLDFYVDGGRLENNPSTLVVVEGNKVKILRQGKGIVPSHLL